MNETTAERLEMRWLPVVDAAGRTRMEATWVTVPAAGAPELAPAVDARRLSGTQLYHGGPSASRSALWHGWGIFSHGSE